jgi:ketosteroid isomerase-like protein
MMNENEVIRQLEFELVDAFLQSDVHALNRILAEEFIITDPHGPSFSKPQYLEELSTGRVAFKSLAIDEIEVRVIDNTAVVTGKATADGRSEDGPFMGQYSFMDVYLKKNGRWHAILSAVNRAEPNE